MYFVSKINGYNKQGIDYLGRGGDVWCDNEKRFEFNKSKCNFTQVLEVQILNVKPLITECSIVQDIQIQVPNISHKCTQPILKILEYTIMLVSLFIILGPDSCLQCWPFIEFYTSVLHCRLSI